jgi:serine/threonine protein kinase
VNTLGIQTTVGAYRLLSVLGEGSMGTVYVGEHTLLGRRAAIKVLLPELSANDEAVQRFFNEARAITQIADPGLVQVFDFGHHTDGSAYIVMELLDGETLDKRLQRLGRFDPLECIRLTKLMCSAIAAAHAKGVVHRDLKPENILIVGDAGVTGGERPKILDFGIAKLSRSEQSVPGDFTTLEGMLMGTPLYMSPEQCRGDEVDHRADIYSLGCVLMMMLTGQPPFDYESSFKLLKAHRRETPPLVASRMPGVPDVFDCILQRCLAKLPENRYQSMTELLVALRKAEAIVDKMYARTVPAHIPAVKPKPAPVAAVAPPKPRNIFTGAFARLRR